MVRLSVIGAGYLGVTHAACMADLGYQVVCVEVDRSRVAQLSAGVLPFHEPGLPELLSRSLQTGRLTFTSSYEEAAGAQVHFICVGTPQQEGRHAADLSQVFASVDSLAPHLDEHCLVVGKSTVPVGTAREIQRRVRAAAPAGAAVEVAWNPEFLREGHAVHDTLNPDRLVVGTDSTIAEAELKALYEPLLLKGIPWITCDFETAELVKMAANAFLATKISFINAMAEVCEATGADVEVLASALAPDPRIGGQFLKPGLGFGGGCLPKDIRAFMSRAGEIGAEQALTFLREVDDINRRRRVRAVDLAVKLLGEHARNGRVAVLGAAFKPHSDDIRDSPALEVASALRTRGLRVVVHDPQALDRARRAFPLLDCADNALDAVAGSDLVMHLTEWPEYRELDPSELAEVARHRVVIDGRGALDVKRWVAAGWTFHALGRPPSEAGPLTAESTG